jgi:hypothetical protein
VAALIEQIVSFAVAVIHCIRDAVFGVALWTSELIDRIVSFPFAVLRCIHDTVTDVTIQVAALVTHVMDMVLRSALGCVACFLFLAAAARAVGNDGGGGGGHRLALPPPPQRRYRLVRVSARYDTWGNMIRRDHTRRVAV